MKQKQRISTLALILCIGLQGLFAVKYIQVEAPFPMKPIQVPTFPEKDFKITSYGAKAKENFDNKTIA